MLRLQLFITFLAGLLSCNDTTSTNQSQTLDFGSFTIETPGGWTKIEAQGIDSHIGKIAIDDSDTLAFDLGWYSNDLTEYHEIKTNDGITSSDTARNTTLIDSANKSKVAKSNVSWDTIDGRRAKILSTIKPGIGATGIYVDSLWKSGVNVVRFNLYGTNLKPENEKAALAAFKTLKFHKVD